MFATGSTYSIYSGTIGVSYRLESDGIHIYDIGGNCSPFRYPAQTGNVCWDAINKITFDAPDYHNNNVVVTSVIYKETSASTDNINGYISWGLQNEIIIPYKSLSDGILHINTVGADGATTSFTVQLHIPSGAVVKVKQNGIWVDCTLTVKYNGAFVPFDLTKL